MKTDYVNVNGYLIPKLKSSAAAAETIGKYGMIRARYLDEQRPMERDRMLLDGTLAQHLADIDREAHRQVKDLTQALAEQAAINEAMKCRDPLKWAAVMQEFRTRAEEIVCAELIYAEKDGPEAPKFPGK